MFKTSHLQELKRRYREMYLPKSEKLDEHCGVCGEGGEHGIEEGKPSRKLAQRDVGMECQECGKKFRAKLSTLQYGKTKCPKCKSTDLDFAYGESVEVKEDSDKDEPGTQGDQAEYQKKRKEVMKKFGVGSCSELEGEKKKACYAALDAAHVSDDEEDEDDDPVGKNEEVEIKEGYQKAVLLSLDDAGIDGHFDRDRVVVAKRDVKKAKEVLDDDPDIRRTPKIVGEEVELDEKRKSKKDFDIYHKTYTSAVTHAADVAKRQGYEVDPDSWETEITFGQRKPSEGKSVSKHIKLTKDGKPQRKMLHLQVYGMKNEFELNMYIESAEEEEIDEGTALQVKMALDDVGLKGIWKNNKVYVKKKDVEKAKKALKGNVIYKGKPPIVVGEEVEIEEGKMPRGIRLTSELLNNIKKFGVELEKYAKKSGGIDKDDFMRVAAIAKKGAIPDKSDIPDDTDPRDKVLSMMAAIVGDEILLAYKGISPSIDNYIKKTMKEHCGECEMGITEEVSAKEFDALKKGDTVTIEFKSPMSTGKATFKVTAKNVVGKARIEKVTLKDVKRPSGVKFFLYKRGNKVSLYCRS